MENMTESLTPMSVGSDSRRQMGLILTFLLVAVVLLILFGVLAIALTAIFLND